MEISVASSQLTRHETHASFMSSCFFVEHRRTKADLFWKALKRHRRVEGRLTRIRRSRGAHSSSRVHTEVRQSYKIRKSAVATIFASFQQYESKHDTQHSYERQ